MLQNSSKGLLFKTLAIVTVLTAQALVLAQTPPEIERPKVIALLSVVGDQVTFSRQRESVGTSMDPIVRKTVAVPGQALNMAVLKGLKRAMEKEDPESKSALLVWNMPPDIQGDLAKRFGEERNIALLKAVTGYLRDVPQRAQWDRIEVIVPRYARIERDGMGSKLGGIGIYVQPLASVDVEADFQGDPTTTEALGDHGTVNPKTGERGNFSTYVAPYFYFDRVTFEAATLDVVARKSFFDNIKFHDPLSTALDVGDQMPVADTLLRLVGLMEQSAYRSVRGVRPDVTSSPLEFQRTPQATSIRP